MTNDTAPKARTGSRLLRIGLAALVVGILLVVIGFSTTHVEMVPGTFRTQETQGTPTPIAWLVLIAGVGLTAFGLWKSRR